MIALLAVFLISSSASFALAAGEKHDSRSVPRGLWVSTLLMLVIAAWVIRQWPDRGLWYDETVNAYFAERSWSDIWEWCTEIDNQMPLDFALRKVWGALAGTSEFSLRAFSVGSALLCAAGVIALGRRVGGSWIAGWAAALALVLSQGFLYAAFEVRPYALALALFAWSSVVFWDLWEVALTTEPFMLPSAATTQKVEDAASAGRRMLKQSGYELLWKSTKGTLGQPLQWVYRLFPSRNVSTSGAERTTRFLEKKAARPSENRRYRRLLIAYVLLMLALLYTHYTAFMALAVHGTYAAWQWLAHPAARWRVRALASYLAAGLALGYAPWLVALAGRDVRAGTAYAGEIAPGDALQAYAEFYIYGQRIVPPDVPPYLWGVVGVVLVSLAIWIACMPRARDAARGLIFGLATVIVPLVGLLGMVYGVQAKLSGRHGWPVWIGASLVMGAGLAALNRRRGFGRWLRWPVWIGALLTIWLPTRADLQPVYNSYLREAFAYINQHAEPGDVLILRDGTLFTAAGYYDAAIPWIGLPPDKLTDVNRPLFFDTAITDLARLIDTHDARRVWVVAWQGYIMDPQNLVEGILEAIGDPQPLEGAFGFGDVTVLRYVLRESPEDLRARILALDPVIETPGGGPVLLGGYVLNAEPVPHGGTVHIQTWWQRGEIVMPDLRVSVRLYDRAGEFYMQIDQPPVAHAFGQERWQPDVPVLGRFALPVAMMMPSGRAEVRIVLYHMQGAFEPVTVTIDEFEVAD